MGLLVHGAWYDALLWYKSGRIQSVRFFAERDLLKAQQTEFAKVYNDAGGAFRWITVHPWGDDERGIPVKIRESKTEKGVWHVVGGAGGKLNYLKLTNIKSPEEYKKQQTEKKRVHKEAEKARREFTKEQTKKLTPEEREAQTAQKRRVKEKEAERALAIETEEREIIKDVAGTLGWKEDEWSFEKTAERLRATNATEERIAQLERAHHKRVFTRAEDAIKQTKRQVLLDADLRAAAGLGDLPLTTEQEGVIALADLDPDRVERGLGYRRDISKMSDAEVQRQLALEDIDRLKGELDQAQKVYNPDAPVTGGTIERIKGELRTAEIIKGAAGANVEELDAHDKELKKQLDEVTAELGEKGFGKRLEEAETPEEKAERARFEKPGETDTEIAMLQERRRSLVEQRENLAVQLGSGAVAVKGERKELQAKRQQEREREIEMAGGDVGLYRDFLARSKQALAGYHDEIQAYRAAGILVKPDLPTAAIQDPQKVMELLKKEKALKVMKAAAKKAEGGDEVNERIFGKGYFVETRDAKLQESVKQELSNMLAEQSTSTFLHEVEATYENSSLLALSEQEKRENLQRHMSAGSFNALNHAGLVIQGVPMLGRDAVDVLGAAGAAQVLAWGIRRGKSPEEVKAIAEGLGDYHLKHHLEASSEAVRTGADLLQQAKEIELEASKNPADLQRQQEVNARRREYLLEARELLGQTLGELEATAALELALKEGGHKEVHVTLGPLDAETAIRQARAIGLGREDYTLDYDGTNRFLTVKESGFSRMLKPVDPEEIKLADEVAAIKRGDRDEQGWIPPGLVSRPSTSFTDPGLTAPKIATHQQLQHPMSSWGAQGNYSATSFEIEEHIGARIADGEDPNDILPDILSRLNQVPEAGRKGVTEWLNKEMPLSVPATDEQGRPVYRFDRDTGEVIKGADGKPIQAMRQVKADFYRDKLNKLAERYMQERYGTSGKVASFHTQSLRMGTPEETTKTSEAMYRALAEDPRAMVAWKDPGDLASQDQAALRHYFLTNIAKQDNVAAETEKKIEELGAEPERTKKSKGLFGEQEDVTPEWSGWNNRRNAILAEAQGHGSAWGEYLASHSGNVTNAYRSIQDKLKGDFIKRFAKTYAVQHGEPLRLGKQGIQYAERHVGFVDPAQGEKMRTEKQRLTDTLRTRARGKYATGTIADKVDGALREEEILRQNQIGMFGTAGEAQQAELGDGERLAIGETAENQIKSLMDNVGRNFRGHTTQPVKLARDFSMSGEGTIGGAKVDLVKQQRTVKAFLTRKRLGAYLGTGSGKTAVMLGGFTAAASDPKTGVKRGIFLVPSQIVGQMHGEMGQFVDPQRFHWSAQPGATFEQRMADHRDAGTNMVVQTHEAFRDDMMRLLSDSGVTQEQFEAMPRKERAATLAAAWKKNGMEYQAAFVDEGHRAKKRRGQEESLLSKLMMAASDTTPYMMTSTADPLVNDVSEIRDQLDRLEPDGRYSDEQDWHKRYGLNTTSSREALRHEVSSRFVMSSVSPATKANRVEQKVDLTPEQNQGYAKVVKMYERVRASRAKGKIDVEAMRELAPDHFKDLPEAQHEDVARRLSDTVGLIREAALRRVINMAPPEQNAKMKAIEERLKGHSSKDKPVIIFSHNPSMVNQIADRLKAQGHKVVTLSGANTGKEKDASRRAFQGGQAGVIVMSDAGATGLNLQRAQSVINFDTPVTAMTHAQRQARAYRLGQTQDVDLVDVVTNTPFEERARQLLTKKYARRSIFSEDTPDNDDELETAIRQRRAQVHSKEESEMASLVA